MTDKKYRDAVTGEYVTKEYADEHPETTVAETSASPPGCSDVTREDIARTAYNVNRAYCQALGDNSFGPWEDAPEWQKNTCLLGVDFHLATPGATAAASHESWFAQKVADGWVWGPKKDPEKKEHPCMVPFDELPQEQQAKDYLFKAVVDSLRGFLEIGEG